MTAEAYAKFYRETYRDLIEWYTPGCSPVSEESQTRYAKKIIPLLEPYVDAQADSLLDIGGAPGVCAQVVAEGLRLDAGEGEVVVLDPACRVTAHAEPVSYVSGSIEDDVFTEGAQFDVILCCQTVDHLLDLRGSLEKMRGLLTDDGVLWIDIMDWLYLLRQTLSVEACIKVDHPYGLNEMTFVLLLLEVGLEPVRMAYQGRHIGFVCKRAEPQTGVLEAEGHKNPVLANVRKKEAESKWSLARGR
jgi:SAM-dependent methyltransferase